MNKCLLLPLLIVTIACGREAVTPPPSTSATATSAPTAPAAAATASAPEVTPVALVQSVYDAYAWEPVADESSAQRETLFSEPEPVLDRYFDDSFKAAILKDRACVERTKEICNLDFLPIWQTQDPTGIKNVQVVAGKEPNSVIARFIGFFEEPMEVRYSMTQTARGWRISDMHFAEGDSIKTILSQQ